MYVVGVIGVDVDEYFLSTAFDVSSASFTTIFSFVLSQVNNPWSFAFNNNGTKMYVLSQDEVNEYNLSSNAFTEASAR